MAEHLYRRPLLERVTNQEHVVSSGVPVPGVHRFLSDPKPGIWNGIEIINANMKNTCVGWMVVLTLSGS